MPSETWALKLPRIAAGSNGASDTSRSRSMRISSAAACTGPSILKCTRAGGACGEVSGTSNTPLVKVSLRPDGISAVALPIETMASRPTICTFISASRSAGRPLTGRTTQPMAEASIERPSSGTGGPLSLRFSIGEFTAITMRSTVPLRRCSLNQSRTFGVMKTGQSRFIASAGMRVPARPAASRGLPPARSRLPDMAIPTPVLPTSPSSTVKRCLAAS